ncbi:capsular biosynthesis protein [Vibrio vulnificus]|uniref:capsular biosynthesis protein n=1 Tax=Vibrio vulnificus TaxID=672 RepID=UPI001A2AEA29|nr:capsular biosynthesis protein [Vibrio vulnificus]EKZ9056025.1 capsular biosynthesis protein [Vibrio vulnificus]ELV8630869.1 capsular biosynthesis protein [Vibrio vulnificus]MCU8393569.1 capsular biosynthesis protein [Vibrio vulnificus]MCU8538646.1 capsular biosynthesis protein [Vibrio vulnificus]
MKKLVMDLDGTLTMANTSDYRNVLPRKNVVKKLKEYKEMGYSITIFTARNMRTYEGNLGKINIYTLPIITEWLDRYDIPYDEIIVGKPWCGHDGFYVDDRAIRPSEFETFSFDEISQIFDREMKCSS